MPVDCAAHSCKLCFTFETRKLGMTFHRCDECNKTFTTLGSLKRHQQIHTRKKAFSQRHSKSGTDVHTGHKLNACQEDFPMPGSVQVPEVVHKLPQKSLRSGSTEFSKE